jgi:type III secretion YscU/HrpY family protein
MAGEKTEQPTPKRLRDARQKGQIFKSADLVQAFLFLASAVVLSMAGASYIASLKGFMVESFQPAFLTGTLNAGDLMTRGASAMMRFLMLAAPLLLAVFVVSAAANFVQVGVNFAPGALSPKFSRLNPVTGFQNLFFKSRTYIDLIKNVLKLVIVGWIAWSTLHTNLRDMVLASRVGLAQTASLGASLMFQLLFKSGAAFLIMGAADYMLQRRMYMKSLMMSKDEVLKEYKQEEGDPHIKHQRKHLHQELLMESARQNVAKATAVVVNPTHLAIALKYEDETMNAPRIVAKGQMKMAQKIVETARQHRIPIVRNVPLAHGLYRIDEGHEIPEELYEPVAEVLNWVYQLSREERI